MSNSNYLEAAILDWIRGTSFPAAPATVYVGLSTADPTEDGSGLAEPSTGNGYARQAMAFDAVVQGADAATITNSASVSFGPATASWGTVTHFAIFDAVTGGNMLRHAALTASRAVASGDTATYAAGALTLSQS